MSDTHSTAGVHKRGLIWVLVLTTGFMAAEVWAGLWTHSLALLADAGHMLTDAGGLGLALFAIRLAERPATPDRTYGYYRAEILAALANAIILIGISVYILYEAYERFRNPPVIQSGAMFFVALLGMGVNLTGVWILRAGSKNSLNIQGAYFEVLSDLLASVGVMIGALVMWFTGWYYADPLISAAIGLFILPRTWRLLKEATGILLEGTPAHLNVAEISQVLQGVKGVKTVHDLHVWTLTSGFDCLSGHLVVQSLEQSQPVLAEAQRVLHAKFSIRHATLQIEIEGSKSEPFDT